MITTHELATQAGLHYQSVHRFIADGIIEVDGDPKPGCGGRVYVHEREVFYARAAGDLMALGATRAAAAAMVSVLRNPFMRGGLVYVDHSGGVSRKAWREASYVLDLDSIEECAHAVA